MENIKSFYEGLERSDLFPAGKLNQQKLLQMPITKLVDYSKQFSELTFSTQLSREKSIFSNSASLSLGGGVFPCSSLECRIGRLYSLAQYATLYGDRIYIRNFFSDHSIHPPSFTNEYEKAFFYERFYNDLALLWFLRPLIERKIIITYTPTSNACPHCFVRTNLGEEYEKRLKKEEAKLHKLYLNKVSVELEWDGILYSYKFEGPEVLVDHGHLGLILAEPPAELLSHKKIINHVHSEKVIPLSKYFRQKIAPHQLFITEILQNIKFELATSQSLKTSFLTENPIHIEILNSFSDNPLLERRNNIVQKHLTSLVPFIDGITLKDIIKIREREEESFIVYRKSLNKAIEDYRNNQNIFTERHAKEIYSDVIAPNLAKLDRKVKEASKDLFKSTSRKIISTVGAISFGIFLGFLPKDLIGIASTLGLAKVISDLLETSMQTRNGEKEIRQEEMYFLWKVRQVGKKKSKMEHGISNKLFRGI